MSEAAPLTARTGRVGTSGYTAYDQGAQLATWTVGDVPVIWQSSAAHHETGRSIRGGVPICWPWFGPGRSGDLVPQHGFARTAPWQLVAHDTSSASHLLRWRLDETMVAGAPGTEHFGHPFEATCEVEIGDAVTVRLTVRNTGQESFDYEVALHSYLHVGDVRRARVTGLEGATLWDKVRRQQAVQQGVLTFEGQTDSIFTAAGTVRLHDPVLDRIITVTKEHAPQTVVWTPWQEAAAEMGDMADQEWTGLVCIEAAAVGDDAVRLQPGAEHTIGTRIMVSVDDEQGMDADGR